MATANSVIKRALRLIGVLASGETMSSEDAADGLEALNAMLDSWRNDRLMCYAIQDESLTLVSTQASYSIGPSGDLNTTRPVKIEAAYVRASSTDYPVTMLTDTEWDGIYNKASQSDCPEYAYYAPTMSTGTLYVWPVPNAANTLHLKTWTPLTSFSSLATVVTLPPGYEEALTFNLALRIAPEHGVSPSADVRETAITSKAGIKRVNSKPIKAYTELPKLVNQQHHNIITDQ